MRCRPALGLAWILFALAAAVPGGAARPPVTFAVLREDGILVPVATFDGKWKNKWPAPAAEIEVPITLSDVPKGWWPDGRIQREWTFWPRDGEPRRLSVTAPVWTRAQCVSNVGLRTDYTSEMIPPDPETMPYPKAGLVTSAGADAVRFEPVSLIEPTSENFGPLLKELHAKFATAEAHVGYAADFQEVSLFYPLRKGPIVAEAVYRGPDVVPGRFIYYVEMTRRYTGVWESRSLAQPDAVFRLEMPCAIVVFASGWARVGQGRQDILMEAQFTDCRREDAVFQHPLGVIRVHDGRPLWIVQWSTWQAEWYSVIDFGYPIEPRALLETWGGGCR